METLLPRKCEAGEKQDAEKMHRKSDAERRSAMLQCRLPVERGEQKGEVQQTKNYSLCKCIFIVLRGF